MSNEVFVRATTANPEIDLLVNNAGTYIDRPFLEMDFDTFDRTMKLNVYSYFFMSQAFAKRWVAQKTGGRILLIGSINGRLAEPDHAAYDTSKGAGGNDGPQLVRFRWRRTEFASMGWRPDCSKHH